MHSLAQADEVSFRRLLSFLAERGTFVGFSEAVELMSAGSDHRKPYYSLSVDDAFGSCSRIADVADDFDIPVCFFVPARGVGLTSRSEVEQFFRTPEHIEDTTLTWSELEQLKHRGHEIGSHSLLHLNLATLSTNELTDDLATAKQELTKHLGPIHHFAWPFGTPNHFHDDLLTVARSVGYSSVSSAIRGSHVSKFESDRSYILRDHCPAEWPLVHHQALLARSARRAT